MPDEKIVLGVAPVRRRSLSLDAAVKQKTSIMKKIKEIFPQKVSIIEIDEIVQNGIASELISIDAIVDKFKKRGADALFIPFCDFGEETVAGGIAAGLRVPTLIWGPRDESPNTDAQMGRDTQCGIFAATKVICRYGVKYSYIVNCPTDSEAFTQGFTNFIRAVSVVKTMKNLRIAKFGNRPEAFMSVIGNESGLLERFGIVAIPISAAKVTGKASGFLADNDKALDGYINDITARIDCSAMAQEEMRRVAALKLAIQSLMKENNCNVASMECWSAYSELLNAVPCLAIGELADEGMPVACEGDLNGAVTLAILQACSLGEGSQFFADLTIRHPQNDNAELLWHCGPFPYSLKDSGCKARLAEMMGRWQLKKGDITITRFDDSEGKFYLFAGEGKAVDGPETTGTYVWFETDDWKKWEEKLVFGPYIHHVGGTYGRYISALREAARYLDLHFDTPDDEGIHSL